MESKLGKFEGEVRGENTDGKDSYLSELESLAQRTKAKVQVRGQTCSLI